MKFMNQVTGPCSVCGINAPLFIACRCQDVCESCFDKSRCECGMIKCHHCYSEKVRRGCYICNGHHHNQYYEVDCDIECCRSKKMGRYILCCKHRNQLENISSCYVCGYELCRSHAYECKNCHVILCKYDMHSTHDHNICPNWKDKIRVRMDVIENKYMIEMILEYL